MIFVMEINGRPIAAFRPESLEAVSEIDRGFLGRAEQWRTNGAEVYRPESHPVEPVKTMLVRIEDRRGRS
jgi:hypothetical protein